MKFKHGTRRRALEYEKDWVRRWKDAGTFEKSISSRPAENAYVFYDGPPFITGVPHHGTLLSSIVKDAIPRYQTMKGRRVERVWGWDCHGLPAENFVEKQLNITDRRQIVAKDGDSAPLDKDGNELPTISLEKYITKARESMVANSESWESVIDRIGRWVDFKGAYRTMDKDFMESVWWAFKELYEKGKIYEGEKVLMYDTKFATPVSKNEVTMDNDAYQTVTDPSVYVKFKLRQPIKSFLMGTGEVDKKLEQIGVLFEKTGTGNYKVTIPEEKLQIYEDFVKENLKPGFWNEYVDGNKVVFMFKDKQGDVSRYIYSEDNETRLLDLMEECCGNRFESVKQMISGNDWYASEYLLAWTTTPWTLPANLMLAVSPELTYVEVLVDNGATLGAGNFAVKSINNPVVKKAHDVLAKFEGIEYGHVDKDGYVHRQSDADYDEQKFEDYRLQGAEQVAKNQTGVCWDQTEYTRYLLEQDGISTKTYAIVYYDYDNDSYYNHTIAVFESEGSYYWLEHSMADIAGIYEFSSLDSLISSLKSEFLAHNKNVIPADYQESRLRLWEYDVLRPDSSPEEVFGHWERAVNLDNLLTSDEKLILTKGAIERVLQDDKHKPLKYKIVREFPGSELVGESYEPLATGSTWPQNDAIHKIYAADFVSHESGSGIVHVAPAYGEDDFELAKSHGVEAFHVIDDNGYYTDTNYKGLEVWENNKFIAKDLKEKGIVWKIDYIRHEYPFNPRSKQRIMYRAIPSWFFDIQGSKPLMLEQNENVNWFPEHLKHGRFAKNIEQAPDWNLSRDRFWATAMPVWKGDKGSVKVVGSYAELKELSGVELEDYHRPWVDDITFEIDGEKFTRIDKVLDCWFESGSMPFAQFHYPFENKEKFEANYPGDFIVEYVGQVRAWFYYVHAVNTALFGEHAFGNVITTGVVAGNDGRKMSKSLGNFTDPNELMDKFSADSLRFLLLGSPLLNGEDFSLLDKDVGDVARKLSMIWNMYDFFTMYAEVDNFEFPYSSSAGDAFGAANGEGSFPVSVDIDKLNNPLDIWIISRLHQLNQQVTENLDGYNIPDALSPILPFIDDASNWFVRRSRRRFWKSEDDGDKNDAYKTLHYVLLKLAAILAPITPFLAEELYQNLGGGSESIHLIDWPTNFEVNQGALDDMERTRSLINAGLGLRMKKDEHQDSIKVRQPLQFASYAGAKLDDYYEQIMAEELNVKEIRHIDSLSGHLENYDEVADSIDEVSWIEISKKITPELKREGLMREVIRFVQSARKNAGLNVDDRINLSLETSDADLGAAISAHRDEIYAETLAVGEAGSGAGHESVKVDGIELKISLEKA